MITDGMGYGRSVFYGFVLRETYHSLRVLFEVFVDMIGGCTNTRTVVMDKSAAQIRAARFVLGCDVLLCYFHVWKAVKSHVSRPSAC